MKKLLLGLCVLLLVVGLGGGGLFFMEYSRKTTEGNIIDIEIPEGASTKTMARLLKDNGVIRFQSPFLLKVSRSEYRGKLRYGKFALNDGMSLDVIIEELATGGQQKESLTLTIPEGFTAEMIAARLEEQGIMKGQDFLDALTKAADSGNISWELPEKDKVYYQLQGYLYPDTYYVDEDVTPDALVQQLLDEFAKNYDEKRRKRAEEIGLSVTEVLTRASLLEKETELPEEYPIIAGVINNRLEKGMKIQFDSTVVYAMTEGKYGVARVLYADLEYDSPYNTYQNKGLPPGPICNPSMEAIDGVLYAEENPYLFFQTDTVKKDGSNLFFETYDEHRAASSTANRGGETETSQE